MDAILEADSKPYVSPILKVEEFSDRAVEASNRLSAYFQIPALLHFQNLQASTSRIEEVLEDPDVEDPSSEVPIAEGPSGENSNTAEVRDSDLTDFKNDCRVTFKYFLNSKGIDMDEGDEIINFME